MPVRIKERYENGIRIEGGFIDDPFSTGPSRKWNLIDRICTISALLTLAAVTALAVIVVGG